jgi:nitrite reductase/ring-hydroxylating ferredoxin subunit
MQVIPYKRNVWQRMMGRPMTSGPADPACWTLEGGRLAIELQRAPELDIPFGAISLAGEGLPGRVLVLRDGNGVYRAFANQCTHGGRCLDPVGGAETLSCCSVGQSRFDYDGKVLSGSAKEDLQVYAVGVEDGRLLIDFQPENAA